MSPNIHELLDYLYKANNDSDNAFEYIQILSSKIDNMMIKNEGCEDDIQENLAPNLKDNEIHDCIETFMQNIELLIDNH